MLTPITRHVLSLNLGHTDQPFGDAWEDFCRLVRSEWGRLGVRSHSPAILGYAGDRNWRESWDDLTANAYVEAVLQPAPELVAVLKRQPPGACLDALVRLKIRRHFQACRAEADPVGASVYRRVCSALRRLVDHGTLAAVSLRKGRYLRKETMLSFPPFPDATLTTATELAALLPTLPDWSGIRVLLACTRRTPLLPERLRTFIQALGQAGCRRFQVGALVATMQRAARQTAHEMMRSRAGTPVAASPDALLTQQISPPDEDRRGSCRADEFETRCHRVRRWLESSGRGDARHNRLRVLQACLPTLRQGYWPSVREVVEQLGKEGERVGRGSVGEHLRALKEFWAAV